MDKKYQDVFDHFSKSISKELCDYVENVALLSSRYMFTRRVGSFQKGYCTHCKKESMTDGLKHNQDTQCPKCKSLCIVKASGRGRSRMLDEAYVVWYEKSVINSQAIVARGLHVIRDYRGDYYQVETQFRNVAVYVFEPGKSINLVNDYGWRKRRTIVSEVNNSMKNKRSHLAEESIVSAVHGTPFQYSMWSHYLNWNSDMVKFFDVAAKYPCIEYLTKLGLRDVVEEKIYDGKTYGVVNWRGDSIEKVLRMNKSEIRDMRNSGIIIKTRTLYSYHLFKKRGIKLSFQEADQLELISGESYLVELEKLPAPFERIIRYFLKQLRNENVRKYYSTSYSIYIAFRDYIKDCKELGMNLSQEHILFPNNLHEAHQKTIRKVKIKADVTLNYKITKRLQKLEKYKFEKDGMFIRPAQSSIELFDEGKMLEHCVGRYAETYANGKTDLFLLRKVDKPDEPFYTVEIIDGKVQQVRGKKNCKATEDVESFMNAFVAEKLVKKKMKSIKRQEVAV